MTGRFLAVLGTLAVLVAGCGHASRAAPIQVISITPVAGASSAGASTVATSLAPAATAEAQGIKVYVVGAVARPGVYALPPGSRIEDAVKAAGGFVAGADMVQVNLAAKVRDEQEIYVPTVGEAATAKIAAPGSPALVNINTATSTSMVAALGISLSLARKIVTYRNKNGPYASADDLQKVPVPAAELARIRGTITTR
ncbi:MAG: SLBB domain-containing protein [Chloroflexota bacterium]